MNAPPKVIPVQPAYNGRTVQTSAPGLPAVGPVWTAAEYIQNYKWNCTAELKRGLDLIGSEFSFRRISGTNENCGYVAFAAALVYFHSHHLISRRNINIQQNESVTKAINVIMSKLISVFGANGYIKSYADSSFVNLVTPLKTLVEAKSETFKKTSSRFEGVDFMILREIFSASKIGLVDASEVGRDRGMSKVEDDVCLLYVSADNSAGHYDLIIRKKA